MGNEAAEEQSRSRRTMCSEPAVAHRRKHEQPRKKARAQSKGKGCAQIARAKPKSRYQKQIQECERDPNHIMHGDRDRYFMIDWGHPPDVTVQELPTGYRGKPPARQTGRQEYDPPQLECSDTENIHGDRGEYPDEDTSYVKNGHTFNLSSYSTACLIVSFLCRFAICIHASLSEY